MLNLLAMIGSVVVNSFGTRWFNTWLPSGYTTQWYSLAWNEFQLPDILLVTLEVVGTVVADIGPDRRADGLCNGASRIPRQAGSHAAVPAAPAGAANHLRHPARDGALPGTPRRPDLGRHSRQPRADRALRHPDHDPVRGADRSTRGGSGACVRRRHRPAVRANPGAAADAGHSRGAAVGAGAYRLRCSN